ncbi:MAG: nucleotide exchange factor GrpE [Bacteroides sp.]|nr:nucleotide exchange factor GrpE [Bacteroides sp.]MDD2645856.1 nucleotide exchange factor GrpE [Bacteroides sp.]MDD4055020.1 nucleotide exchange factor GrpE [Bacteroides sp.]MDD4719724.1 nucleotide exchange factor GrpE [Bacteroides sp.]NLI64984.1 nucleotide exchange factor GrpE [Bacteroidales bacterium]
MSDKKRKEQNKEEDIKVESENQQEELNLESKEEDNTKEKDEKDSSKKEKKKKLTKEEKLEEALQLAEESIADQKDKYLRLAAEFDNYRKRTMKEKAELVLNGGAKSISSILPVVDDLERAIETMKTATDVEAVKEGVDLIYQKFIKILGDNGVQIIETIGQKLNTDLHDAIAVIPAPTEEEKGKIVDCVQTGYTINEKVIRHAKVVVGE